MNLLKTMKVLRQLSSVSASDSEMDDALLVGDIELLLRVLKMELGSLAPEEIEPRLMLSLSRLNKSINNDDHALVMFKRAAEFVDQNRGYYSDLGYCSVQLCRDGASQEFRSEVRRAVQKLLEVCPFPDDLQVALHQIEGSRH